MSDTLNLAELLVRISGDASGLKAEMAKSVQEAKKAAAEHESAFGKIGASLLGLAETAAVAAAAVAVLAGAIGVELTKVGLESASQMSVLSEKLNASTESLSGLKVAAEEAGVPFDTLSHSLGVLQRNIGAAVEDNDQLAQAFAKLGLSADELAKLHTDEAFGQIADALNQVGNATERAHIQAQIFGRDGIALNSLIREGSAGFAEAAEKAKAYGFSLSDIDAKKAREATIALEEIRTVVLGIAQNLAVDLAPYITAVAKLFTDWAASSGGWKDAIGGAVNFVAKGVGLLGDAWQKVVQGWESAKYSFAELSVAVLNAMNYWSPSIAGMASMFKNFFAALSASWDSVKASFGAGIDWLATKFGSMVSTIRQAVGDAIVALAEGLRNIKGMQGAADALFATGAEMQRAANRNANETKQAFDTAAAAAYTAADKAKGAWSDFASGKQTVEPVKYDGAILEAQMAAATAHDEWQKSLNEPLNSTVIEKKLADIRIAADKAAQESMAAAAGAANPGGTGGGKGTPDVDTIAAEKTRRDRLKQLEKDAADARQIEIDSYVEQQKQLQALKDAGDIDEAKRDQLQEALQAKHQQKMLDIDSKEIRTADDLKKASGLRQTQWALDSLASIINGVQAHSKRMFDIQKAVSFAAATIDIAAGACKAFGQGGFYGFAMAAAVVAAGAVQLATIASQQYQGGTGSVSSPGSAPSAATATALPSTVGGAAGDLGQTVHIHIDGAETATVSKQQIRNLVEQINDQARDGVRIQSIQVS